jgi:hypothetical protein
MAQQDQRFRQHQHAGLAVNQIVRVLVVSIGLDQGEQAAGERLWANRVPVAACLAVPLGYFFLVSTSRPATFSMICFARLPMIPGARLAVASNICRSRSG